MKNLIAALVIAVASVIAAPAHGDSPPAHDTGSIMENDTNEHASAPNIGPAFAPELDTAPIVFAIFDMETAPAPMLAVIHETRTDPGRMRAAGASTGTMDSLRSKVTDHGEQVRGSRPPFPLLC